MMLFSKSSSEHARQNPPSSLTCCIYILIYCKPLVEMQIDVEETTGSPVFDRGTRIGLLMRLIIARSRVGMLC
jgi:hypothetical protein